MTYPIEIRWDTEAFLWVAVSREGPALVLEDPSLDALIQQVRQVFPALLAEHSLAPGELSFHYDGFHCR